MDTVENPRSPTQLLNGQACPGVPVVVQARALFVSLVVALCTFSGPAANRAQSHLHTHTASAGKYVVTFRGGFFSAAIAHVRPSSKAEKKKRTLLLLFLMCVCVCVRVLLRCSKLHPLANGTLPTVFFFVCGLKRYVTDLCCDTGACQGRRPDGVGEGQRKKKERRREKRAHAAPCTTQPKWRCLSGVSCMQQRREDGRASSRRARAGGVQVEVQDGATGCEPQRQQGSGPHASTAAGVKGGTGTKTSWIEAHTHAEKERTKRLKNSGKRRVSGKRAEEGGKRYLARGGWGANRRCLRARKKRCAQSLYLCLCL